MTLNRTARRRYTIAVLCAGMIVAGCSTLTPAERAQMQTDAARPVACAGEADCEMKWGRALQWVLDNSSYKIAIQTPTLITTMGPLPDDPSSAFTVSRIALGQGRYSFDFRAGCNNFIACIPSVLSLKASFVRAVMGTAP